MSKMSVRPLGNRVLVKRSKAEKSKGGILLPDTAKEKPREGEVVAVGPGKKNDKGDLEPLQLQIGERVLFSSYSGTEVKNQEGEEEYLILTEDDILGVLV